MEWSSRVEQDHDQLARTELAVRNGWDQVLLEHANVKHQEGIAQGAHRSLQGEELSWTQGANGHFYLPNPKPMAPFGLQVQVPSGCNIQRINFWHACVVLANSNINSGYCELEQIGWQEEHGYMRVQ